jgi:hypothetical protein
MTTHINTRELRSLQVYGCPLKIHDIQKTPRARLELATLRLHRPPIFTGEWTISFPLLTIIQ